ncbi:MAG: SH3 domain-containing protein [Erysipelotrichaceae bacterium]|jgi:hypothetical protein|nr:SH3 domain-containing protein [Erysipelotrichaceae bacterium]MCH4044087.1 SH3 domain-containing protein [Erysipelotrichaceae bacterium]MCH4121302.1 SH3 domain-containing protein [Erysipelotrichaceae bacterium]
MKKENKKTGSAALNVIKTILIYAVLTAVLLFAGTRVFGVLMNSTTKAEATASASATPTATPTATSTVTPTPTPTVSANTIIGTITIGSSEINVRSTPSTTGDLVTTVQAYSSYKVYETTTSGGYTWYRIAENEWVPDGGNWLTYQAN